MYLFCVVVDFIVIGVCRLFVVVGDVDFRFYESVYVVLEFFEFKIRYENIYLECKRNCNKLLEFC